MQYNTIQYNTVQHHTKEKKQGEWVNQEKEVSMK